MDDPEETSRRRSRGADLRGDDLALALEAGVSEGLLRHIRDGRRSATPEVTVAQGKLPGRDEERLRLTDARRAIVSDYEVNGKKTVTNVRTAFGHLEDHLGDCPILSITTGRLRRYIVDRQEEGAANATIRKETAALKRGLNLLQQDGALSNVPRIPNPKVSNARKGFLEAGDVESICDHPPRHAATVVRFLYLTGWRKSEAFSLQWSQVDFDASEIRLEPGTTKNEEDRTFPFRGLPPLQTLLREQRERVRALERKREKIIPWVFHYKGERLRSIRTAWVNARKKAGLPDAWIHDLRRSAVRNMERAGVSRSVAMKLSGHKTESVYRRYAIADKSALEEGVEKLASLHDQARSVIPLEEVRET